LYNWFVFVYPTAWEDKKKKGLDDDENTFWLDLIKKYLKPLKESKKKQKKIQDELIQLRLVNPITILLEDTNALSRTP